MLAAFEDEQLYRMEWVSELEVVLQMITNSEATITDARGSDGVWTLRALYPTRELVQRTAEFCEDAGLGFDIQMLRELEGEPAGRYGLTDPQFEALRTAVEEGFYQVPRETSLEELADQLGISHQAASERVRRTTESLVEETLFVGASEDHHSDL